MCKSEKLCLGCSHKFKPCEYINNCDLCISYGFDCKFNETYGLPMGSVGIGCKRDENPINPITRSEFTEIYKKTKNKLGGVNFKDLFDFLKESGLIKEDM